ncbi:TPA: CDP-glycerol glycerophosphotransferase family protein [Photobacterium damselae]
MNKKRIIRILKRLVSFIGGIFQKDEYSVIFKSVPDYSGNAKAFSDYLDGNKKNFKIIWLVENPEDFDNTETISFIKSKTLKGLICFFSSKYIVTTHNEMVGIKSKNQVYISLWHGMPLKKICYLGKDDYIGMEDYSATRIATSEMMRSVISASFHEKANNVYITGQPRNDYLFSNNDILEKIGISKKQYSYVFMYMPTFRENLNNAKFSDGESINNNNFLRASDFNLKELNKFLEEKNILLLVKLHPFEEAAMESLGSSRIKIIKTHLLRSLSLDVNEILSSVNCLITDYSSVFFDFMILDRPMIFFVPDEESYSNNRGGFILEPFEFWTPGPHISTQKSLIYELERVICGFDDYVNERQNINKVINKYSDSKNCERVFKEFFNE